VGNSLLAATVAKTTKIWSNSYTKSNAQILNDLQANTLVRTAHELHRCVLQPSHVGFVAKVQELTTHGKQTMYNQVKTVTMLSCVQLTDLATVNGQTTPKNLVKIWFQKIWSKSGQNLVPRK